MIVVQGHANLASAFKDAVRRRIKGSAVAGAATLLYRGLFAPTGLTSANPHLTKVSIAAEIDGVRQRAGGIAH